MKKLKLKKMVISSLNENEKKYVIGGLDPTQTQHLGASCECQTLICSVFCSTDCTRIDCDTNRCTNDYTCLSCETCSPQCQTISEWCDPNYTLI